MKHFISLGAGVQSSTMALMFACGELTPMPDGAIFADTQAEPQSVYRWLDWLEKQLLFPVHRVTAGSLRDDSLRVRKNRKTGTPYMKHFIPTYSIGADGSDGTMMRKCTTDFKVKPIVRAVRRLAAVPRGSKKVQVVQFIGISLDEVRRMKPSVEPWIEHRWPLVDARMTRSDCLAWMQARGHPMPPRSACSFCPYHSNIEWRRLQTQEPDDFAKAVQFEKDLNACSAAQGLAHVGEFLHPSRKPLDTIDFRSDVERGQGLLFDNECEGMCGV